jgi:hypothetical protein
VLGAPFMCSQITDLTLAGKFGCFGASGSASSAALGRVQQAAARQQAGNRGGTQSQAGFKQEVAT